MTQQTIEGMAIEVIPEDDIPLPVGWELVDKECVEEPDGPAVLKDIEFLESDVNPSDGEKMFERAMKLGNRVGLRRATALMRLQEPIPASWRGKKVLVFTGAVACDPRGFQHVLCGYWKDWDDQLPCWSLYWSRTSNMFRSFYHIVRFLE